MTELAIEETPAVADDVRQAAAGQVVYFTENGKRIAGIVPAEVAVILERLSPDELAATAAEAGRTDLAGLLEDLADRAADLAGNRGHQAWRPSSACPASAESGRAATGSCTASMTTAERSGSRTCGSEARHTAATDLQHGSELPAEESA